MRATVPSRRSVAQTFRTPRATSRRSRPAGSRSLHPRRSRGPSLGPRGPGRALATIRLERALEQARLDAHCRHDLLEVAHLVLHRLLRCALAAAASKRLRDAHERVLAPPLHRRRQHAETPRHRVHGRLARPPLQHRELGGPGRCDGPDGHGSPRSSPRPRSRRPAPSRHEANSRSESWSPFRNDESRWLSSYPNPRPSSTPSAVNQERGYTLTAR
jgi:hypothetical protein